ncbi:MAG: nucleotide sugar dehydrogenase [Gemmatimonadetes bacterium]|nr:nucleotide sugar dehydrogenase [Gemmatimonadota bacterium]
MTCNLTVIGLGYVGLPLASEACRAGLRVLGYDNSSAVVEGLNAGTSHIDDVTDDDVVGMRACGFVVTGVPTDLVDADVLVICVPTPLSEDGAPDLSAVIDASKMVAIGLRPGCLVVLESTTYPGTTDEVVRPLLELGSGLSAGVDFSLAYSPERIDPGNPAFGLCNTPKIVGGLTPTCTERAVEFYEQIVDTVVPTVGLREAELAKLLENTYRHVNIALMNEMVVFCHELDIDLWSAIEAASTKPFGFEAFYPGPGVGGHCIPIDPNYLSWVVRSVGYRFRFVELAQEISERMPIYIAQRVQTALNADRIAVNGSRILLLGVTYKADISDQRESPARPLAAQLLTMGAEVRYFDPHVDSFLVNDRQLPSVGDLASAVEWSDVAVLVQAHGEIVGSEALAGASRILDTRGVLSGDNVERL